MKKIENHALHGLVHHHSFDIIKTTQDEHRASVLLRTQIKESQYVGFPFDCTFDIEISLTSTGMTLHYTVTNTGNKTFPFGIGWHPYFKSNNLDKSSLEFDASHEFVNNNRLIPIDDKVFAWDTSLLQDKNLDDGYQLQKKSNSFLLP